MNATALALVVLAQALHAHYDREPFDPDVLYPAVTLRFIDAHEISGKARRESFDGAGNQVGTRMGLDRNLALDESDPSARVEVAFAGRTWRDRQGHDEEVRLSLSYLRLTAEGAATTPVDLVVDGVGFPTGTAIESDLTVNALDLGGDWIMQGRHLRLAYHFGGMIYDSKLQVDSNGGSQLGRVTRTTFLPSLGAEVALAPIPLAEVFLAVRGFGWRWDDGDNDRFSAAFGEARAGVALNISPAIRAEAAYELLAFENSGERGLLDRDLDVRAEGISFGVAVPWGIEARPSKSR